MKLGRLIVAAALAVLTIGATPPRPANWNATIVETPQGGHLVGNPNARAKLIAYVSYTCPHCAHFAGEADAPLRLTFIAGGKGSVEYRPFLRNKIDIAATLLANCGPTNRFWGNHTALLRGQDKWLRTATQSEERRWASNDFAAAMRAIASDLKLYDVMQGRGYTRAELDRCLMNRVAADKLAEQTQYAAVQLNVRGTPSFIVNGQLHEAHDWAGLRPRLMELTR